MFSLITCASRSVRQRCRNHRDRPTNSGRATDMGNTSRSAAAIVTGLALALLGDRGTTLPASAADGCAATFDTYKMIQKGSTGSTGRSGRVPAGRAGYTTTVNGRITAAETQQIAKFRKDSGMPHRTALGSRGWAALLSQGSTPTLAAGDSRAPTCSASSSRCAAAATRPRRHQHARRGHGQGPQDRPEGNKLSQTGTVNAKTVEGAAVRPPRRAGEGPSRRAPSRRPRPPARARRRSPSRRSSSVRSTSTAPPAPTSGTAPA